MSWQKYYGQKLVKMLEPADLGFSSISVLTAGLPITGQYFELGAFDRFQFHSQVVITGGDRSAGTVKFTLETYNTEGGTLLSSFDLLTGVQRFGAATTKRGSIGFGPSVAAAVQGDGSPTAGASLGLVRAIGTARIICAADAAYSGGTTDPTSAFLSCWLMCSQ